MNDFITRNKQQIQSLIADWVKEIRDEAVIMEKGEQRDLELELAKRLDQLKETLDPKKGKQNRTNFI